MSYLIYKLVTYEHYAQLGHSLRSSSGQQYAMLAVAMLLVPIQLLAETRRWQWFLQGWKSITLKESWAQVLTGQIAGFITPYRAGDIPARLAQASLDNAQVQESLGSNWKERVRAWFHNGPKWCAIVAWTLIRYAIWGAQLWSVLYFVAIPLNLSQSLLSIALYYFIISIMPALPAADIPLKGGWAVAIFGTYSSNTPAILLAISIIWFFNTVLPVLFACIKKFL